MFLNWSDGLLTGVNYFSSTTAGAAYGNYGTILRVGAIQYTGNCAYALRWQRLASIQQELERSLEGVLRWHLNTSCLGGYTPPNNIQQHFLQRRQRRSSAMA